MAAVRSLIVLALLTGGAATAGAQTYTATDIPFPTDGFRLQEARFNAHGQAMIVFGARTYFYDDGALTDIGDLGGGATIGHDINDAGQIVGKSLAPGGQYHAFRWTLATGMLDQHVPWATQSEFNGVDEDGQVAGSFRVGSWTSPIDGFFAGVDGRDLGKAGSQQATSPIAMNDYNQIAGTVATVTSAGSLMDPQAFLWDHVNGLRLLDTLGGPGSIASGMNDSGMVVGRADTPQIIACIGGLCAWEYHPFVFTESGGVVDLGTFGVGELLGEAHAVNNHGQVVGSAQDGTHARRAFIWDATSGLRDLSTLVTLDAGWVLDEGVAIDDTGVIIVRATFNGAQRAMILTPAAPEPPPPSDALPFEDGDVWRLTSPASPLPVMLSVTNRTGGAATLTFLSPWVQQLLYVRLLPGKVYLTGIAPAITAAPLVTLAEPALLFDMDAAAGSSWATDAGWVTVVTRNKTVVTASTTYTNGIQFLLSHADGGQTLWTFVPGVGLVQFGDGDWAFVLE